MNCKFLGRSQPVCEPPEERESFPQREIPRERWLKRFIESYRRNCSQLEMLTDYTKSLEAAYYQLQQENDELKADNVRLNTYVQVINEPEFGEPQIRNHPQKMK